MSVLHLCVCVTEGRRKRPVCYAAQLFKPASAAFPHQTEHSELLSQVWIQEKNSTVLDRQLKNTWKDFMQQQLSRVGARRQDLKGTEDFEANYFHLVPGTVRMFADSFLGSCCFRTSNALKNSASPMEAAPPLALVFTLNLTYTHWCTPQTCQPTNNAKTKHEMFKIRRKTRVFGKETYQNKYIFSPVLH